MSTRTRIQHRARTAVRGGIAAALLLTAAAEARGQAQALSSPDERNVVTVGIVDGALV